MSLSEIMKRVNEMNQKLNAIETSRSILGSNTGSQRESDEKKLLRAFRCRNLSELLQINTCAPQYRHVSEGEKFAVIQLKEQMDVARFYAQIFTHQGRDPEVADVRELPPVRGILDTRYAKQKDLKSLIRSFSSTSAGDGEDWVPTIISSSYIEEYELQKKVVAAFKEMPMTGNPFELPVQTSVKRARLIGEGNAITDTSFGTDVIAFNAKKLGEYYLLPEELNEDSAPNFLELARRDVVESQVRAIEDAIINGDTTLAHMDADVVAADSNRKAWNGLRKIALAAGSTVDFGGGVFDDVGTRAMRAKLGKYGTNPKELAWILSPLVYAQAQALERVTTLEKFGPQATVLTGALAILDGIPVICSEYVREDLSDAGVYDGVTTDRSTAHLVNFTRFMIGRRRPIRVRAQQDARLEFDRWQLASYQRLDFKGHKQFGEAYADGSISAERSSVLGIDILI